MSDLFILFMVYGSAFAVLALGLRMAFGPNWVQEIIEDSNIKALFEREENEITKKD